MGITRYVFLPWCNSHQRAKASSFSRTHDLRHITLGRTPLDEWSDRRRDLYLTTDTHKSQTSILLAGIAPTIPASERPHTHALDRKATRIGTRNVTNDIKCSFFISFISLSGNTVTGQILSENIASKEHYFKSNWNTLEHCNFSRISLIIKFICS